MNKKQQEAIQLAEFAIHCAQKHGAEQVNVYIQSSENEKLVITVKRKTSVTTSNKLSSSHSTTTSVTILSLALT